MLAFLLSLLAAAPAPPPEPPFRADLRDGSVLFGTLEGPIRIETASGAIEISPASLRSIELGSRHQDPAEAARIEALIRDLGADEFSRREEAQRALLDAGPRALGLLEKAAASPDPEIASRVRDIRETLRAAGAKEGPRDDRVEAAGLSEWAVAPGRIRFRRGPDAREIPAFRLRVLRAETPPAPPVRLAARPPRAADGDGPALPLAAGERFRIEAAGAVFDAASGAWIGPEGLPVPGRRAPLGALSAAFGRDERPVPGAAEGTAPAGKAGALRIALPPHPANAGAFWVRLGRGPAPAPGTAAPWAGRPEARAVAAEAFGPGAVRIGFDRRPDASRLAAGEDVSETFLPLGVRFRTPVAGASVGTDAYEIEGGSRGLSAAVTEPRWTGDVELEFVAPPGRDSPGARRVGARVGEVFPGGTGLRALGAGGVVLGEVLTAGTGAEFLGIEASEPIAKAVFFAVPAIDPNFAIDDLVFEWADPAGPSDVAFLRDGSRLAGEAVSSDARALLFRWGLAPEGERIAKRDLDRLRLRRPPGGDAPAPAWQVVLAGGGTVPAASIRIRDGRVEAAAPWGRIELPAASVSTIRRLSPAPGAAPPPRRETRGGRARLSGGRAFEGEPVAFDPKGTLLLLESSGARREIPAAEVDEILLGDRADPPPPEALVRLRGGLLPVRAPVLGETSVRAETAAGPMEIPREHVAEIEFLPGT